MSVFLYNNKNNIHYQRPTKYSISNNEQCLNVRLNSQSKQIETKFDVISAVLEYLRIIENALNCKLIENK